MATSNNKLCAALSYLLIGIIWYFADEKMKSSSFAKFHFQLGTQKTALTIAEGAEHYLWLYRSQDHLCLAQVLDKHAAEPAIAELKLYKWARQHESKPLE